MRGSAVLERPCEFIFVVCVRESPFADIERPNADDSDFMSYHNSHEYQMSKGCLAPVSLYWWLVTMGDGCSPWYPFRVSC